MKFQSSNYRAITCEFSPSSNFSLPETFVRANFLHDQSFVRIFFAEFPFDIIYIYSILQPATTAPVRED